MGEATDDVKGAGVNGGKGREGRGRLDRKDEKQ
jgi:hypothetical protein